MSVKKSKKSISDKKYYILDLSSAVIPVANYKFGKNEVYLKSLVDSECFFKNPESKNQEKKLEKMINEIGFEWDPLSEAGHMRQMSHAVTITEAIEKYSWLAVKNFCDKQGIPLYKVSGGELFDVNVPDVKKQISIISKSSGLYGSNQYNVIVNEKNRVLRYNACIEKLSLAKRANLKNEDLPVGFFEISKSYRFEEERELQLCKRVRSFRIPELDVINDSLETSMKMAADAHADILKGLDKLDPNYELLCSVTHDFLKENFDFLKTIAKSIKKPILLAVYNDACCKDGVKIDIEYKTFDSLKSPVEIATCLVDDGSTEFSIGLKFQTENGLRKSASILHVVFPFASVERFAYFLIDRAIKNETKSGFRQFPFWSSPIQIRIITTDNNSIEDGKKLAQELELLNFRVDLDDRRINYKEKRKADDLKWIPYVVTVDKSISSLKNLIIEDKIKETIEKNKSKGDLIRKIKSENDINIIVPRYVPMFLSKRAINGLGQTIRKAR